MKVFAFILAFVGCAFGGEYAVLSNGFRIHADRHEIDGNVVKLYSRQGVTEFNTSMVAGYEVEEPAPAQPAPIAKEPTAPAPDPHELVSAAARKHGLPPKFVHSVVAAESAYRADAISRKGAIGLMQLMPATAQTYNADPKNPEQNVQAGTAYLRDLLLKYQNYSDQVPRALAAYNAGPGAVDRYKGIPPYRETQSYVDRVIRKYRAPGP
jgi:soluble lytic murein transglycosylase-like protein